MLFGGLTLWLENDLFIKLKPTVVNLLFAAVLFTSLALSRQRVEAAARHGAEPCRDRVAHPDGALGLLLRRARRAERGVWRTMTTDAWVNFKVFGIMPLTLLFSALQMPVILKHQIPEAEETAQAE